MNYRRNKKLKKTLVAAVVTTAALITVAVGLNQRQVTERISSVFTLSASASSASSDLLKKMQSKEDLIAQIEKLSHENNRLRHENRSRALLLHENRELKKDLGRDTEEKKLTITRVIARPPVVPFDTLTVDLGEEDGVEEGTAVYAADNTKIGEVDDVFNSFSRVTLYSSVGEKTPVEVNNSGVLVVAEGAGGGALTIQAPHTIDVRTNDLLTIPALEPTILGEVKSVESKDSDAFSTVRARLPINIYEIEWVYLEEVSNE